MEKRLPHFTAFRTKLLVPLIKVCWRNCALKFYQHSDLLNGHAEGCSCWPIFIFFLEFISRFFHLCQNRSKYLQEMEKYNLCNDCQISLCLLAVPNGHIQAELHSLYFPILKLSYIFVLDIE